MGQSTRDDDAAFLRTLRKERLWDLIAMVGIAYLVYCVAQVY